MELPLWFRAEGFHYEATQEFSLSDIEKLEKVEFKLSTENGLPLNSDLQIYFEDANGIVLDSLLSGNQSVLTVAPLMLMVGSLHQVRILKSLHFPKGE